ncbi:hypothetical protein JOB18_023253 [Solea senegalensis]|uniref:Uncharacterized protein n=1 Tax=Solea senegalensis TaxID=28829 RepID=A0AAV6T6U5_SOLSE|nr:hypothetical protein JOB18_023253 [Solea senegalensis]
MHKDNESIVAFIHDPKMLHSDACFRVSVIKKDRSIGIGTLIVFIVIRIGIDIAFSDITKQYRYQYQ